jgi:hypothetical protein
VSILGATGKTEESSCVRVCFGLFIRVSFLCCSISELLGKQKRALVFFFFIRSTFLCCLSFRAPVTREGFFKFLFLGEGTLDSRIEIWPLDGIQKGGEKVILIR